MNNIISHLIFSFHNLVLSLPYRPELSSFSLKSWIHLWSLCCSIHDFKNERISGILSCDSANRHQHTRISHTRQQSVSAQLCLVKVWTFCQYGVNNPHDVSHYIGKIHNFDSKCLLMDYTVTDVELWVAQSNNTRVCHAHKVWTCICPSLQLCLFCAV